MLLFLSLNLTKIVFSLLTNNLPCKRRYLPRQKRDKVETYFYKTVRSAGPSQQNLNPAFRFGISMETISDTIPLRGNSNQSVKGP